MTPLDNGLRKNAPLRAAPPLPPLHAREGRGGGGQRAARVFPQPLRSGAPKAAAAAVVAAGLGAALSSTAPAEARVFFAVALPGSYVQGFPGIMIGGAIAPHPRRYDWHDYALHHPFPYRYEHWH